jgi:hypothetical protein
MRMNKLLDIDNYPTNYALKLVENHDSIHDIKKYLNLIEELWSYKDRFCLSGKKVLYLYLSTGGWSGNEKVIDAMQKNNFWMFFWQKSIRGGHYWFRIELKCLAPSNKRGRKCS